MKPKIKNVVIYNSVGFVEATSNRMKRSYETKLKLAGFTTFSLRIKKPYVVNSPVIITTAEGVKFLFSDCLTDRDLKAINEFERFYFGSQREFEEYLSALGMAKGLILPMATRPTTLYLLAVAEKYGIKIPTNVHEHRPILHITPKKVENKELIKRVSRDYEAMFTGEDTGSPLTEFYFSTPKRDKVISRRLKRFIGDKVFFEDGTARSEELLKEMFGEKIATGIMRWVSMR